MKFQLLLYEYIRNITLALRGTENSLEREILTKYSSLFCIIYLHVIVVKINIR